MWRVDRRGEALAAIIDDALARGLGSAVAVSVGDGGREVVRLAHGFTRRVPDRGEPIDDTTPFDIASLTKPIATAAIAMVAVGDRKLDLEAPIRSYLPDAASTGSVRDLLGHAAGYVAHVELYRALRANPPADPRAELVARAMREPCQPPGVAAVYSDLGYITLGAVLERATGVPLELAFAQLVAEPLGLAAKFAGTSTIAGAVATELDDRGLVCGRVHDENAYYGGGVCGHAGLFASIADVAAFAEAIVATANGEARGRLAPYVVEQFFTDAPVANGSWRLGWDTPAPAPGNSQAGDRWPREGAVGHLGFTGTSLWLDLPRRRWCALLANRVHPTRGYGSADAMRALRRAVNDAALD